MSLTIGFNKEIDALGIPKESYLFMELENWGRSIAERVELQTIERCIEESFYDMEKFKVAIPIRRLYASSEEKGAGQ